MSKPQDKSARTETQPFDPTTPTKGDFRPDGSWNPEGSPGDLYRFIQNLISQKKRGASPWEIALEINRRPHFAAAFPNALSTSDHHKTRWTAELDGQPIPWFAIATSTSAEAVLKHSAPYPLPLSPSPLHHDMLRTVLERLSEHCSVQTRDTTEQDSPQQ
jgi:hypothetical protein